jgi:hypothetical protein
MCWGWRGDGSGLLVRGLTAKRTRDWQMNAPDEIQRHSMSTHTLEPEKVREDLKAILLGPAGLYEALRQ